MDEDIKDQNIDEELEEGTEEDAELAKSGGLSMREKGASIMDEEDDEGQLAIDLYQTPDELVLETPIAGTKREDLDISVTAESVTIKGKREKERKIKDEDYFYQETFWGRFAKSIVLPQEVDAEKAEADIKNGVLTIKLPKLNRRRSKKLRVQSSES